MSETEGFLPACQPMLIVVNYGLTLVGRGRPPHDDLTTARGH